MSQTPSRKIAVCWISSARYPQPLDATTSKKWRLLAGLADYEFYITGFSTSLRPRNFDEQVHFYLIPQPPTSILRYLTIFTLSPLLLLYLIWRHDASILVAQSPFEGAVGAWLKLFCRLFSKNLKLIIENHNNFEEDVFLQRQIPLMNIYRRLMLALARFAFRHGDAVRVISTSTSQRASHYAPDLPQIRFMTWSDVDIFQMSAREIPVSESQNIIYAGVLIPRKGVHHLLTAFSRLFIPEAQLYLVGHPENSSYAAELRQQAQQLGISDRVHFEGAVPQAQLARYFGRARVMVLPSLSEGLGRVIVEAMLLGTPVIGSRVGGIPDLIQHGENGYLVNADDLDSLTNALEEIFKTDTIEVMSEKAKSFAQGFFLPEAYVAGYGMLFEQVRGNS